MKLKFNHICRGLLFSGLILTNISCSDSFLELNNPNQVSDNTFWQSENDALMGLAACYDALQSDHLYDDNVDGGGFGFLMRETSTDNGQHTTGCREVQFLKEPLQLLTDVFLIIGMQIMN